MDKDMIFTQFGLRRTGTNVMRAILENNFNQTVKPYIFSWKHEPPLKLIERGERGIYPEDWRAYPKKARKQTLEAENNIKNVGIVISFRNPASWLFGMNNFKPDQNVYDNAEEYLRRYVRVNQQFCKLLKLDKTTYAQHIELIREPRQVTERIAKTFRLEGLRDVTDKYIGPETKRSHTDIDRDFYIKEEYRNQMPKHVLRLADQTPTFPLDSTL